MIGHDALMLGQVEALAGLPAEALSLLASGARLRHYRAGASLLRQGECPTCLYVVRSGTVIVQRSHRDIVEPLVLQEYGAGDTVGGLGLLDRAPSVASVVAVDEVEVLELEVGLIARVLLRFPATVSAALRTRSTTMRTADDLASAYLR